MNVERILLTGGAGFLGHAILRELAKPPGDAVCVPKEVRVFDLVPLDASRHANVVPITGDVCDYPSLLRACEGVDVVLHAASLVDWGQATPQHLAAVNVGGTENVVRACREAGVPALVYTSTMDVVCGTSPVVDADETTAYPARFTNDYARTKALAEQRVLQAHGDGLTTCAVRPCGMFGERDPYHVASVLRILREGGLPFRLGSGRARFQHVYVGNVAHAHLLALRSLLAPGSPAGGQAYFVTDDVPAVNFFDFLQPIVEALGYELPPRSRSLPYPLVLTVGAAFELAAALCRPFVRITPTLTRSSVRFVCHDHTFDGRKARRDLGYAPIYGEAESLSRTIAWFREQQAPGLHEAPGP